jgi:hypothetical protein
VDGIEDGGLSAVPHVPTLVLTSLLVLVDPEGLIPVKFRDCIRTGGALVASALFVGAVSTGAAAVPDTFNVSTTVASSCVVTDAGPANLTPTYSPTSDSGTGSETVLNTFCNGTSPGLLLYDAWDSGGSQFAMSDGTTYLFYQISNTATCSGVAGDNPLPDDLPIALPSGTNSFDLCAAVTTGGSNVTAPAGAYTDTVTYSIAP